MRWTRTTLSLAALLWQPLAAAHAWQLPLAASASNAPESWSPALSFAVAYYPTQWPASQWDSDAQRMAAAGIRYVRLAEFDWALLEPKAGTFDFSSLDAALEVLDRHGLQVILGTPTATPPRWAVRDYDILGADANGDARRWGSRRSYSFSSPDYLKLSDRVTKKLAQRYGRDRRIVAWQLDNEFGCHNTVRSFDKNAAAAFRGWLRKKYGSIEAINLAQGRVFWSSQFENWQDIEPPTHEVTESHPAHRLDWFEFSSAQVAAFAKAQVQAIRKSARQPITTNFFGSFEFDHHAFARETGLDFATWDSYPLGYTESTPWVAESDKITFARTGRPDAQSLHHAIYRGVAGAAHGVARGEWGVMEQQPGPVNWASHNPSPATGMIRLWLHEIFAHGGSLANIFRWRQVPFGQEQMHAAMLRPDSVEDVAFHEQQRTREDLALLQKGGLLGGEGAALHWTAEARPAKVALVLDYNAGFVLEASPQGGVFQTETFRDYDFQLPELLTEWYSALRRLALDVDVISPHTPLHNYSVVVVPTMPKVSAAFDAHLAAFKGHAIFGPRTASKVDTLSIAPGMPPAAGALRSRLPMKVVRVESLRKGLGDAVAVAGLSNASSVDVWSEWLECERDGEPANQEPPARFQGYRDGHAAACEHVLDGSRTTYLGWYARAEQLLPLFAKAARDAGVRTVLGQEADAAADLGAHVRLARRGDAVYAFNYGMQPLPLPEMPKGAKLVVGAGDVLEPAGVSVWHLP